MPRLKKTLRKAITEAMVSDKEIRRAKQKVHANSKEVGKMGEHVMLAELVSSRSDSVLVAHCALFNKMAKILLEFLPTKELDAKTSLKWQGFFKKCSIKNNFSSSSSSSPPPPKTPATRGGLSIPLQQITNRL